MLEKRGKKCEEWEGFELGCGKWGVVGRGSKVCGRRATEARLALLRSKGIAAYDFCTNLRAAFMNG